MRLRTPTVIPVTRFAIGSSLPEQSLSPPSSGTGFASRGEPGAAVASALCHNAARLPLLCAAPYQHTFFKNSFIERYPKVAEGRVLVAANQKALSVLDGGAVKPIAASLAVYRIGADGTLAFVAKHDVTGGEAFWIGIVKPPAC